MTTKEIVEKVNASFLEGNTDAFLELCADDVVWTMVGDNHVRGKETIRKWMAGMNQEPPSFTVRNIIAEGDFAACHGDMTMKNEQGGEDTYAYCDVYRMGEGKVQEMTSYIVKTGAREGNGG